MDSQVTHPQIYILKNCTLPLKKIHDAVESKIVIRVIKYGSAKSSKVRKESENALVCVRSDDPEKHVEEIKEGLSELTSGFQIVPYKFNETEIPKENPNFWFIVPKTEKNELEIAKKVKSLFDPLFEIGLPKVKYLIDFPVKSREDDGDITGKVVIKFPNPSEDSTLVCAIMKLFINDVKWNKDKMNTLFPRWEASKFEKRPRDRREDRDDRKVDRSSSRDRQRTKDRRNRDDDDRENRDFHRQNRDDYENQRMKDRQDRKNSEERNDRKAKDEDFDFSDVLETSQKSENPKKKSEKPKKKKVKRNLGDDRTEREDRTDRSERENRGDVRSERSSKSWASEPLEDDEDEM